MKIRKKNLAFFGGKKAITYKSPHWKWPPFSKEKYDSIRSYYLNGEKKNKRGYPKIVELFEKNFKKYQKAKYALSTNSGTSALQAAFFAIGLKEGDEVIAPALTFHATATPIFSTNATPVIADCKSDTGNIDPKSIKKLITRRTKAIVITHLCGHPCEMDEILKIKRKKKLFLIEDCSHAHGSTYKGKKVGSFGDIGCFSLDNNKLLAAGEGGVLVTNNKNFFERALLASDFAGRLQNEVKISNNVIYKDTGLGYKHRIHPVSAAIANSELKKINFYIKKRHKMLNYFSKKIKEIPGINPPITLKNSHRGAFYGYRPFVNTSELKNIKVNTLIKYLQAEGMEVRFAGNKPLHQLPLFSNRRLGPKFLGKKTSLFRNYKKKGALPQSEKFYNTTLSLITFTFENKSLINQYIKAFKKVCYYLSK